MAVYEHEQDRDDHDDDDGRDRDDDRARDRLADEQLFARLADEQLFARLAAPFEEWEVKEREESQGGRPLRLHYVDAGTVMNRLDDVIGPANWDDDTTINPDGSARCVLTLTLPDGRMVVRTGIGAYMHTSPAKKLNDPANLAGYRAKAAASDAFKRAAVKVGVGRYLGKCGVPIFARGAFGEQEPPPAAVPAPARPRPPAPKPSPAPLAARRGDAYEPAPQTPADDPTLPPRRVRRPVDVPAAAPDHTQSDTARQLAETKRRGARSERTGPKLYSWVQEQGGKPLLDRMARWCKASGFPGRLVDLDPEQIELAYQEALRLLALEPARAR